jgi:hypothetical protein
VSIVIVAYAIKDPVPVQYHQQRVYQQPKPAFNNFALALSHLKLLVSGLMCSFQ